MRVAKYVHMKVLPQHEEELLTRLRAIQAATRTEPGTELWILHEVRDKPLEYAMYEIYSDEEANVAHEKLPELVDLLPRLEGLLDGGFQLHVLEEMK
jgi:quinol monooxygenase YgiN